MPFWSRKKDKDDAPRGRQAPEPDDVDDSDADDADEADDAEPDESDDESDDDEELAGGEDDEALDEHFRRRAETVIPGGASTGSKRADAMYGPGAQGAPTHFESAAGCRLVTLDDIELVDCTMALGAVALGYGDQTVSEFVLRALSMGHVSGLSSRLEVEVAERLCDVIPCAEQVRFLKSGAEAVAAAVRIARTHTRRDRVIGCGYFGWLDWSADAAGVPRSVRADYQTVPFDDVAALEETARAAGDELAAIVLEPVVERLPSDEWLQAARRICDERGAVLIFDEIKTGFRLATGGYQKLCGVTPDLATFGKAMANGFPLSAVVGSARVMDAARRTWISSTLASEGTALAAAAAVLRRHEKQDVCASLRARGESLRDSVERALRASRLDGVTIEGIPQMWFLRFANERVQSRFLQLALGQGVLFKRGPYNFVSLAHDEDTIAEIEGAASTAFVAVRDELAQLGDVDLGWDADEDDGAR